jgi:hypothetical protein
MIHKLRLFLLSVLVAACAVAIAIDVADIANFSKRDLVLEASLQSVAHFKLSEFLDQQRNLILSSYLEHRSTPRVAARQLNNIVELRKDVFQYRIPSDIKPLAAMLSRVGTLEASMQGLVLMKEIVAAIPHPLHFGELGSLYESMGNYEAAINCYREEVSTRLLYNNLNDPPSQQEKKKKIKARIPNLKVKQHNISRQIQWCIKQHAWRVQDDLLAETETSKIVVRYSEVRNIQFSSTLYINAALSKVDGSMFVGGTTTCTKAVNAASKNDSRQDMKCVQWPWVRKEVLVVEMQRDLILLDAGSTTFGILDNSPDQMDGNSSCVVLTRSVEHMEGWRKLSRTMTTGGVGLGASWGRSTEAAVEAMAVTAASLQNHALRAAAADPTMTIVPVMGAFSYNNHFHWIVEVMTRLVVFQAEFLTNTNAMALIPRWAPDNGNHHNHQRLFETLSLLNVPMERILVLDPKETTLRIRNASLIEWRREGDIECAGYLNNHREHRPQCWRTWDNTSSPNNLHMPPASILRKLRTVTENFMTNQPTNVQNNKNVLLNTQPYIIFVHRGLSEILHRSFVGGQVTLDAMTNALASKLPSYDIKTLDPSRMSLIQQVKLFHGASAIVGPHGAGLSNIAFCRAGTVVVELPTTEHAGMTFFQDISAALDLRHAVVPSVACDKEAAFDLDKHDMIMVADTVRVMLMHS